MTFCNISKQGPRQSHIFSRKKSSPCCAVKGLSLQLEIYFQNLNSFVFKLSFHHFIHLQHMPSNRMTTEKYVLNMFSLQTSKLTLPLSSTHFKRQIVMRITGCTAEEQKGMRSYSRAGKMLQLQAQRDQHYQTLVAFLPHHSFRRASKHLKA